MITADCDISKGKFGRQLACLRVVTMRDYLWTIWADRKLSRLRTQEAEKLRGQVAKWHTRSLGQESDLSVRAAVEWVLRDEPAKICDALQVPDEDRKKVISALATFRRAQAIVEERAQAGKFEQYVALRSFLTGRELQKCREEVLDAAKSETLPDDVFLFPSLPQVAVGASIVLLTACGRERAGTWVFSGTVNGLELVQPSDDIGLLIEAFSADLTEGNTAAGEPLPFHPRVGETDHRSYYALVEQCRGGGGPEC